MMLVNQELRISCMLRPTRMRPEQIDPLGWSKPRVINLTPAAFGNQTESGLSVDRNVRSVLQQTRETVLNNADSRKKNKYLRIPFITQAPILNSSGSHTYDGSLLSCASFPKELRLPKC
jgi:hypothetical protein